MNNTKKLVFAIFAIAGLSGCATTRTEQSAGSEAAAPTQVSMPARSYGSMGGYRYRRFITVTVAASS